MEGDFARDCTATEAARLAPLEAAVARAPKNGRLDRAAFAAEWREAGSTGAIRFERGECDGETVISVSSMEDADRIEQRDLLIGLVERLLSPAHGRQARTLFADANALLVTSNATGDTITLWSSRHTRLFPEGAWLELGPEVGSIFWLERADPAMRAELLNAMAEHRELRGGRPLKWRRHTGTPD